MKKLLSTKPMPPSVPALLRRALGPIECMVLHLGDLDPRYEGALEGGGKCVWLKNGQRVEIEQIPLGGYCAALCNEPDPAYPGKEGMP